MMYSSVLIVACFCLFASAADNWEVLTDGLGVINGVNFFDENIGIAVGLAFIHRTTDGGATWEKVVVGDGTASWRFQDVACDGVYAVAAGIGDTNWMPGTAWSDSQGANFSTTDETHLRQQWFSVEPIYGVDGAFVKTGEYTDVLRSGNGISISANGGKSWTDHDWTIDTPARYASFLDSSAGWVSGGESPAIWDTNRTRGAIAKTTDGGWTWEIQSDVEGNDTWYYNGISFVTEKIGWVIGVTTTGSFISKTTDGGTTWNVQTTLEDIQLKNIRMFSSSEGFAVGGYEEGIFYHGQILHTTDGGTSWLSTAFRGYLLNNIDGFDVDHVYACGEDELDGGVVLQYVPDDS